jgi:hypothetical protein
MNRIRNVVFLVVAAVVQTAPSLTAQQQDYKATVPFEFSAGDRTLPPGEYRISRRNTFLNIENRDGHASGFVLSSNGDPSTDGLVHLVFDEVNDQHFLRRVVAPASLGSIELTVSNAEKKARMNERCLASANPPSTPIGTVTAGGQ